jgi:sugar phosphate isomerase/epimerase
LTGPRKSAIAGGSTKMKRHRVDIAIDPSRRDFLRTAGAASAALAAGQGIAAAEPHVQFPAKARDRLSVTSWPFRAFIDYPGNEDRDRTKPGMDLKDFAALVATRFDVHNVNPLASHFSSTDAAYIDAFRKSIEKAGSHLVDLGLGGRSFYHPDRAKREEAIAYGKQWIDRAVILGSPSVRQHIEGAPGVKADVNLTAETLGELAAYGAKKNIVINLENDAPDSEGPFFLVAVMEKVKSPYLRGLPDFANSMAPDGDAELNYKGVTAMFKHVFNMSHVKDAFLADNGKVYTVDLSRLFAIAKRSGYRGYFSIEADMPGDPYANTERLVKESLKYL